ncbi:MAG TPA: Crp/Fnr family transcriptional regulator [Streptosporangiaceae bacterium]|nr:Crp/Fnr family transcriptional regulator [Streptosporangiaceae bacterium]
MTDVTGPVLAGHQFFRGVPAGQLDFLAGVTSLVTVPAQHRFFEAGAVAQHFWLIRAGQVALDLRAPGAGRVIVETIGRGEMVGVSWFFPPYQWQFGAVALQPTEAFQLDAAAVRDRCDRDPAFGYEFTRRMIVVVAHRLQGTRARLLDVCTGQEARGR